MRVFFLVSRGLTNVPLPFSKSLKEAIQPLEGYSLLFLVFSVLAVSPKNLYMVANPTHGLLRPTLMHTKNLYENGPNPFFSFFFNLMGTRMVQIRIAKSV